jgi:hypothetical protein
MDTKLEKANLIELSQVEDFSLLQAKKAMLHHGLVVEGRITLEQYNRESDEAEKRIDKGEFYTQDEVEEMAKKW